MPTIRTPQTNPGKTVEPHLTSEQKLAVSQNAAQTYNTKNPPTVNEVSTFEGPQGTVTKTSSSREDQGSWGSFNQNTDSFETTNGAKGAKTTSAVQQANGYTMNATTASGQTAKGSSGVVSRINENDGAGTTQTTSYAEGTGAAGSTGVVYTQSVSTADKKAAGGVVQVSGKGGSNVEATGYAEKNNDGSSAATGAVSGSTKKGGSLQATASGSKASDGTTSSEVNATVTRADGSVKTYTR
jgi:hypothetical protein